MSKFKRDGQRILNALTEINNTLVAKENLRIHVPVRFATRGLGQVGIETFICCMYAIITDDDYYDTSNYCAIAKIEPHKTEEIEINGVEYYEFSFLKGQVIMPNVQLVRRDMLIFNIMDEFIFKGNVPWYFTPNDLARIMDTAKTAGDSAVGEWLDVIELIVSVCTRDKKNKKQYFRNSDAKEFDYVALSNVFYVASSTLPKLAGNYFNDGVVSAIMEPVDEVQRVEKLLRE